jgi:hypothetical protein
VVRAVLEEAGIEVPETDRLAANATDEHGQQRYVWTSPTVTAHEYVLAIVATVTEQQRWRREYERAKARAGPVDSCSATTPPRLPDSQPVPVARPAVTGERSESRSDRRPLTAGRATTPWAVGRPRTQAQLSEKP